MVKVTCPYCGVDWEFHGNRKEMICGNCKKAFGLKEGERKRKEFGR